MVYNFNSDEKKKIKGYLDETRHYLEYNDDKPVIDGVFYTSKQLGKVYNKLIQIHPMFIDFLEHNELKPKTDRDKASIVMVTQLHPEYRCRINLNAILEDCKLKGYRVSVKKMVF